MQKTFFPIILEKYQKLPIYLTSAGVHYNQEEVSRSKGYMDFHWIQCAQGVGEIMISQNTYTLSENTGVLIYKDDPHSYKPLTDVWKTDWITFNGFAVHQILDVMGFHRSEFFTLTDSRILRDQIEACIRPGMTINHQFLSSATYQLIMTLDMHIQKKSGEGPQKKMDLVIDYVHQNYDSIITVEMLSELIHVSPQYLCRLFKAYTNHRPFEYINTIRIQKSKELMLTTNLSISQIGQQVGFDDASYFGKSFKKVMGITPGMFRKNYRGN